MHQLEKLNRVITNNPIYNDCTAKWYSKGSFTEHAESDLIHPLKESLQEWTEKHFNHCDVMIFIGSCGIAVRAIAGFVKDKRHDPAIIVMDERGTFCIPLLSGHVGGANAFAVRLAEDTASTAVVTTATDIYNKFAVDVYAKNNGLMISNMTYAKEVSAAILSGEPVGFYTHFTVKGKLPDGLVWSDKLDQAMQENGERSGGISLGIYISPSYNRAYFDHTLWLIPRCLVIGIGCRKGTDAYTIESVVKELMDSLSLYQEAVASVASIDLKAEEPGLLEFCKRNQLELHTYSAEELKAAQGVFSSSEFVEETVGVDNVCERAAVLESEGILLVQKIARDGVTAAIAMRDWRVEFD